MQSRFIHFPILNFPFLPASIELQLLIPNLKFYLNSTVHYSMLTVFINFSMLLLTVHSKHLFFSNAPLQLTFLAFNFHLTNPVFIFHINFNWHLAMPAIL